MRLNPISNWAPASSPQKFSRSGTPINGSLRATSSTVGIGNARTRPGETPSTKSLFEYMEIVG